MKAVILARVSTLRQEEEGLSLDNQENTLREYAKKQGFEIAKEFRFSESADSKIRNKFLEMIEFVKANPDIKAVIAFRVDRITRNFRDAVLMDDLRMNHEKELHFVYDRLVIDCKTVGRDIQDWDLKVFLAKQTLNRLKEDAYVTAQHKLKNGECPGRAPYGYRNIKNEDGKSWVAPDPFESQIVIKIYEWYGSEGYSMEQIRAKLKNELETDMSKGKIDFILKCPFYSGQVLYDRQLWPHRYQTIISKQLYDKVQSIKAGYGKKPFKFAGLPYLYRGLLHCAKCGHAFTPEKKTKKSGREYVYYHCTGYSGKHDKKWLKEEDITRQFEDIVKSIHIPDAIVQEIIKTLKESHQDKVQTFQTIKTELETEHGRYEKRIERMYEDRLDGSITDNLYDKKREEYREKQKAIENKLSNLREADEHYYLTASHILQLANKAPEIFGSSEPTAKRQLLKLLLQNCNVNDATLIPQIRSPFHMFVKGASRTEWLPATLSNQTTFQDEFRYSTRRLAHGELLLVDNTQLAKDSLAKRSKTAKLLAILLPLFLTLSAPAVWAANEGNDWVPSCTGDCISTASESVGGIEVPYGTVAALNAEDAKHIGEPGRGANGGIVGRTEDYKRDVELHLAQNRANNNAFNRGMLQSAAKAVQDAPDDPIAHETLAGAVEFAKQVEQGTTEYEAQVRRVLISYEDNRTTNHSKDQ